MVVVFDFVRDVCVVRGLGCFDDIVWVTVDWFLAEHGLVGLRCGLYEFDMEYVWCGNEDDVDVGCFDDCALVDGFVVEVE